MRAGEQSVARNDGVPGCTFTSPFDSKFTNLNDHLKMLLLVGSKKEMKHTPTHSNVMCGCAWVHVCTTQTRSMVSRWTMETEHQSVTC
mmetsp:Transcript_6008/g.8333  ORF Transcript_6008/g.8333 Transcript_6008/m.8333 type:complete len:88 (-) Transcript_6008:420-683(-)